MNQHQDASVTRQLVSVEFDPIKFDPTISEMDQHQDELVKFCKRDHNNYLERTSIRMHWSSSVDVITTII